MDAIDRPGSLAADHVSGLANDSLFKTDPVWAQVRGEVAALQALLIDIKAKYNLLLAKLDADAGVTDTNYAATLATSKASPNL